MVVELLHFPARVSRSIHAITLEDDNGIIEDPAMHECRRFVPDAFNLDGTIDHPATGHVAQVTA
jgi:hypothetical protein